MNNASNNPLDLDHSSFTPFSGLDSITSDDQTTETTGTTQVGPSSTNPFEGSDRIGTIEFTPFNFNKEAYEAYAQFPKLNPPPEGNNSQPYSPTNQVIVTQIYSYQVQKEIANLDIPPEQANEILDYLTGASETITPKNVALAKSVKEAATKATQEKAHLPSTWDPSSTDTASWTPVLPQPLSEGKQEEVNKFFDKQLQTAMNQYIENASPKLTEEQISSLKKAIASGVPTPDISTEFYAIEDLATTQTQTEFNLPSTWFRGTTTPINWTPINATGIDPSLFSFAFTGAVATNMGTFVKDIKAAAEKVVPQGGDAAAVGANTLADYLKVIGEAIRELKAQLYKLQQADAEKSRETSKGKFDVLEQRRKKEAEQADKMREAREKGQVLKGLGLSMKIIGPILSSLGVAAGVLIALLTAGVGTAAGIAIIAVGVAIAAITIVFSILDSVLGLTNKLMGLVDDLINAIMPNAPDWAKKLVKALIIAAVVVALAAIVVVAMISGGGAGATASIATQTATQVATQVARQVATQFTQQFLIQVIMVTVMGSNAVPELATSVAAAAGASKSAQLAIQITTAVLQMVAVTAAIAIASPGAIQQIGQRAQGAVQSVKNAAQQASQTAQMSAKEISQKLIKAMQNVFDKMQSFVKGLPAQAKQEFTEWFKTLRQIGMVEKINVIFQVIPNGVNVAANIYQGVILLRLARILEQVGDIKSAEEVLQALIQLLEKLLKALQSGMGDIAEFIQTLEKAFNSLYTGAGQSFGKLAESIIGRG